MFDRNKYMEKWRRDNSERMKETNRQWKEKNSEMVKETSKKYREENHEIIKTRLKRAREKRRRYISDYKLSRGCSVCGYNKCSSALDFHHNGDKEFSIGIAIAHNVKLEIIKKEIENCIILCANCHRELHEKDNLIE